MRRIKRFAVALTLAGASAACITTNPDWDPPTALGETGTTSASGESSGTSGAAETGREPFECSDASPAQGWCPSACDECIAGVCVRECGPHECKDSTLIGPASWPFELWCIGKDACMDATIICRGAGSCAIECVGDKACAKSTLSCADGPCYGHCSAGFDQPCDDLEVACAARHTELTCDTPDDAGQVTLVGGPTSVCACETNCETPGEDNEDD